MRDILPILAEMAQRQKDHDGRFDSMDGRFDRMDGRLDSMDGRFDRIEGRLQRVEQGLQANTDTLTIMMQSLIKQFADIDRRFDDMKGLMELKFEEVRSDFRTFREVQNDHGARLDSLESAVGRLR